MAESKEFKRNKEALKRAVKKTKEELKSVARKETVTTYPKGVYKKTLEKNFEKERHIAGFARAKSASKAVPKKRTVAKSSTPKKAVTRKPALKRSTRRAKKAN